MAAVLPDPGPPPDFWHRPLGRALRKATATMVFASVGQLVGVNLFDVDTHLWKVVAGNAIGAALNLAYRWSEAVKAEQ